MLNGGWAVQDLGAKMPGKAGILKYPFADPGQESASAKSNERRRNNRRLSRVT